jgi:CRISPR-associated protein Cas2
LIVAFSLVPLVIGEECDRLKKRIKLKEDSIRIYPITRHTLQQVKTWGVGNELTQALSSTII